MTNPDTRDALIAAIEAGATFEYLYFWGHTPRRESPGKWVFSQWWEGHPFEVDGERYLTAEHFMMAEKARVMGDTATRARILSARTAAEAKKLGRQVTPWEQDRWVLERFDIVVRGNRAKFGQHEELKRFLLSTGDKILVEASPNDAIWGIGLGEKQPEALDPRTWDGLNLLGFSLGVVRAELRQD